MRLQMDAFGLADAGVILQPDNRAGRHRCQETPNGARFVVVDLRHNGL